MIVGDCQQCDGTGQTPHPRAGETVQCFTCRGFKVLRANGEPFKTAQSAKRGGRICRTCKGSGQYTFDMTNTCSHCHYQPGKDILSAKPGDIFPDDIGICTRVNGIDPEDFLYVIVRYDDKVIPHLSTYLGIRGAIVTVTDYGRAYDGEKSDSDLIEQAKKELVGTQWTNLVNKESRRIADTVHVVITRNGYVIRAI